MQNVSLSIDGFKLRNLTHNEIFQVLKSIEEYFLSVSGGDTRETNLLGYRSIP